MTGRLGGVVDRICAATSTIRTRAEDAIRTDRRGGSRGELCARFEETLMRLEQTAAQLEEQLA